ncbi:MAG: NAD(P)H-hydrate epimerase [Chloroflexi bacterium]|nr:MAG: NAD(P)H-hydrate epimerase [Chloroflexota bacterium]
MKIPVYTGPVPYLTTEQMVEVDRAMIEDFRIELVQMMENAGRNLAHLARVRFLGGQPAGRRIAVLAGSGGNGGGALVCARRLHNWGAAVQVFVTRPAERFTPVPAHQLDILRRMNIPVEIAGPDFDAPPPELIIDGIIGYSLQGNPRGSAAALIEWANRQAAPVLALDAPSGVDTTSGVAHTPAIRAEATMTLALPKEGLRAPGVASHVGQLYLADISVPPQLYAEPALALQVGHIFAQSDIVQIGEGRK